MSLPSLYIPHVLLIYTIPFGLQAILCHGLFHDPLRFYSVRLFHFKGGFCFCLIEERNKGNSRQRCAHLQSCCYSRRKPALFLSATQASANAGVANRYYLKQNKTRTLPWYLPQCFERCIFEFVYLQCLFWSNPFTRRKSSGKNRKMAHWNRNMEWPKLTVVKWWPFKSQGNRIFILKGDSTVTEFR